VPQWLDWLVGILSVYSTVWAPQPLSLSSGNCNCKYLGCSWSWTGDGLVSETLASVRSPCPKSNPLKKKEKKNSREIHRAYALIETKTPDFVPRVVFFLCLWASTLPFSWIYYNHNKVRLHWENFNFLKTDLNSLNNFLKI